MALRSVILWTLFSVIVVFVLSTGVQAQELTDVPASDILKQIENKEDIIRVNVNITGKLDLSKINLTTVPIARPARDSIVYNDGYDALEKKLKIVESNITIQDSVFKEDVDFSNTEFRKDIKFIRTSFSSKNNFSGANFARDADFKGANFSGDAKFWDANFSGDAKFWDANFSGDAKFWDANFARDAEFWNANFSGYANFNDANFSGYAKFWNAKFAGYANFNDANFARDAYFLNASFSDYAGFWNAKFAGYAKFWNAKFAGSVNFEDANFARDANFVYANFSGDANFTDANFSGDADFKDAKFAGDANFTDVKFAGDADFNDAKFAGDANFTDVKFAGDADFNDANFTGYATFLSTEFDEVSFTRTAFTNVSLNETDYNQMNVEWSTLKDALLFYGHTYIKLIKNFREMEQFEDADAAYYQYRQLSQANKKWSDSSKLMDVVAWLSCGYGVEPGRPLIWGFILIIVFALVYKLGNGIKRLKSKENGDSRVSCWDAFYFSVVTFTTVGYGDWYPEDRYRKFVMIEGVLGWLLLALFLVTLANVMIRP